MLPEVCVVYLIRSGEVEDEVLLGEKRLGLGRGKMVAPGGKLEPEESAVEAATREVVEEVGIVLAPQDLTLVGDLKYLFPSRPAWSQRSWAFVAQGQWGDPTPSDELHARWIPRSEIPLGRMWADASHWLPAALNGTYVSAIFEFGSDLNTVVRSSLELR